MVDFQTQCRIHGYKYTAPEVLQPTSTNRDIYRENQQYVFKEPRAQIHDCRAEFMTDYSDTPQWEAHILSHGVKKTAADAAALRHREKSEDNAPKKPDKLLYSVGVRGSKPECFNYPRGLAIMGEGNICVADTKNHRIQVFNQCGIFIETFGKKGHGDCEFNEPSSVAILPNGDIAVADTKNNRIQILTEKGKYKSSFKTSAPPYQVTCDESSMIVVSTTRGTIEMYNDKHARVLTFALSRNAESKVCLYPIAVNERDEIIVCDQIRRKVVTYKYNGELVSEFEPKCDADGLVCVPVAVDVSPIGQIIIADSLNHTVGLYTENGLLLEQLLGPTDDTGALQAIKAGPEGHIVALEFTSNGPHSLKIFRCRECECHRTQQGSSQLTTPVTQPS